MGSLEPPHAMDATKHKQFFVVSFGSNEGFLSCARTMFDEIRLHYPHALYTLYTPDDLPEEMRQSCETYKRGYGYWQWKSHLVLETLKNAQDGDIVLYVDTRCGVPQGRIACLEEFLEAQHPETAPDIIAWQMQYIEQAWVTGDVMAKFGLAPDMPETMSGQFAGGIFALRVSPRTRALITAWRMFLSDNFALCRDEPSVLPNHASFMENRHDQCVFSLLLKTEEKKGLKIQRVSDDDVNERRFFWQHGQKPPEGALKDQIFANVAANTDITITAFQPAPHYVLFKDRPFWERMTISVAKRLNRLGK